MAARRKLFLIHAAELAHHLVSAIARDGMAREFVRGYAERHDRRKVVANAERFREIESTISREALLLIAAEVRRLLPRAFALPRNPGAEDRALCDLFYNEFLDALGRALEWPVAESEAGAFRRDLEIYARWRERNSTLPVPSRASGDDLRSRGFHRGRAPEALPATGARRAMEIRRCTPRASLRRKPIACGAGVDELLGLMINEQTLCTGTRRRRHA